MEKFGIATAAEVEVDRLASRIRDEVLTRDGVIVAPLPVGAWARYQDQPAGDIRLVFTAEARNRYKNTKLKWRKQCL